jgi:hypothetical protein
MRPINVKNESPLFLFQGRLTNRSNTAGAQVEIWPGTGRIGDHQRILTFVCFFFFAFFFFVLRIHHLKSLTGIIADLITLFDTMALFERMLMTTT